VQNGDKRLKPEVEYKALAKLPYVASVTDRMAKILRRFGIRTVFDTDRKIQNVIGSTKDKIAFEESGVYEVPCRCGKVYVGETKRKLSQRLHEHKRDVEKLEKGDQSGLASAVAEHDQECRKGIDFDRAKCLVREDHFNRRKIRESIEIYKSKWFNFNRDGGRTLSRTWMTVLRKRKTPILHDEDDEEDEKGEQNEDDGDGRTTSGEFGTGMHHQLSQPCILFTTADEGVRENAEEEREKRTRLGRQIVVPVRYRLL
jgi:hypothetical protein